MDGIIAISDMSWVAGIIGLGLAGLTYRYVQNQSTGTDAMEGLAEQIHDGAMAFLRREYTMLTGFVVVLSLIHISEPTRPY